MKLLRNEIVIILKESECAGITRVMDLHAFHYFSEGRMI